MHAEPSLLDQAIQMATPLVAQPHHGTLPPLAVGAKRVVATSSGLQMQARTHVLDLSLGISSIPLPYGLGRERLELPAGPVPKALLKEFIQRAREAGKREIAAAVVLGQDGYKLEWPKVESSSGSHVRYDDSGIKDDLLLIDLHSHGEHPAYFSEQDNASDMSRRGPYIAMVVGRCNTDQPEIAARVVLPPYMIPLDLETMKRLGMFR